jgi:hypothetical protein
MDGVRFLTHASQSPDFGTILASGDESESDWLAHVQAPKCFVTVTQCICYPKCVVTLSSPIGDGSMAFRLTNGNCAEQVCLPSVARSLRLWGEGHDVDQIQVDFPGPAVRLRARRLRFSARAHPGVGSSAATPSSGTSLTRALTAVRLPLISQNRFRAAIALAEIPN